GETGPQGPIGLTGLSGVVGPEGPQGPIGLTGPAGAIAAKGASGEQGPQGIQGEKGDKGDTGPQGPAGANGADGAAGPQGIQGEKGDTGEIGPKGETGDTGPQGLPGVDLDDNTTLASIDITQEEENRTYNINNQNLAFTNGNIGIGTSSPTSSLHVGGAIAAPIRTTTTSTTLDENDYTLVMKERNLNISLPPASSCPGRIYVLKNISKGNNKTVTTYICNKGYQNNALNRNKAVWLQSDGTDWQQINIQ
ncbi:MAG: hypothetical protein WBM60_16720, partial [Eudoraea sp.]